MKRCMAWILPLFLLVPTAQSAHSPLPGKGNPDRGMSLFSSYCAACHGEFGRGDGPIAPRLARDFAARPGDMTQLAWQQSHTDADLAGIVKGGGKSVHRTAYMPAWGMTLSDQQRLDLVACMREFGQPGPGHYQPASTLSVQQTLELGRSVYTLNCLACHGPRGRGDGPRLEQAREEGLNPQPGDFSRSDFARQFTDEKFYEYAQSGMYHSHMPMEVEPNAWWHGSLNADELQAITLYLRSLPIR